jgi:hypothetical protein
MTTNRVARFLGTLNPWRLVGPVGGVSRYPPAGTSPGEGALNVGDQVRIVSGALAGTEGTIITRYRSGRLIITACLLQQGVSIELDEHQVTKIA